MRLSIIFLKSKRKIITQVLLCFLILPIIFVLLKISGIIFSYTGSVPIGFYQIIKNDKPIQPGDIISFCLPDNIAKIGLFRGYLSKGQCKNGSEPLMKEVIAVPGDQVMVSDDHIKVVHDNTITFYFSPTDIKDKRHLPVQRFINNGKYIATGYWVYGFGNETYSWDSRYYGAVPKSNITHELQPFFIF